MLRVSASGVCSDMRAGKAALWEGLGESPEHDLSEVRWLAVFG